MAVNIAQTQAPTNKNALLQALLLDRDGLVGSSSSVT